MSMASSTGQLPSTAEASPSPFLTVFTYDRDHKAYSYSAFCTKLYFRLRHGGIPYTVSEATRKQAPKAKIPYVRFEKDAVGGPDGGSDATPCRRGTLMGDSALITTRLVALGRLSDLNGRLSPADQARDYCLRSTVEDRFYYFVLHERWIENGASMRDQGPFGRLPWLLRHGVALLTGVYVRAMLYLQGTGRHSPGELRVLRREAVGALADCARVGFQRQRGLTAGGGEGAKQGTTAAPFWILGGEEPTEADFAVFGYLAGILACKPNEFTRSLVKERPELVAYVTNIHERYFPDFKDPFGLD